MQVMIKTVIKNNKDDFFYRELSQAYLQSRTRKSQLCRRCGAFVDGGE